MNDSKAKQGGLQDIKVDTGVKLSALWAAITLCYLYGDYFELYVPGKTTGLLNGKNLLDSPLKLFAATVMLAIPALMVFLSVTLRPSVNKWLNIVFGIFFTVTMLLIAASSMTPWRGFYAFLAIVESAMTAGVVWHALHWPRQTSLKN